MTSPSRRSGRVLVFCTAFVSRTGSDYYQWDVRYRIWLEAVRRLPIRVDQILFVDDGSDTSPSWEDLQVIEEGESYKTDAPVVFFKFGNNLGRKAFSDFPGWVRSFFFAAKFASANEFDKVIHLESDAFLISAGACRYVDGLRDGWTAFWCPRHNRPESGIQVIAGNELATYQAWSERPVESFTDCVIETTLPFTRIAHALRGDRYGELGRRGTRRTLTSVCKVFQHGSPTFRGSFGGFRGYVM